MLTISLALTATLGLRLAAIYWRLSLPVFAWVEIAPPASANDEAGRGETPSPPARTKARVRMIRQKRGRNGRGGSHE
ncbi:hypothetical protein Q427_03560 [Halomonas sp. BC04]|nr:hypothetical protein Q427_03560 [Halomonas sp. BC04]